MADEQQQTPANQKDNIVYIADKPFMAYVTAVVVQFTTKGAQDLQILARGKYISRAIDVAEVSAKRFLRGDIKITKIESDSATFKNKQNTDVRVSEIKITLERAKK